MSFLTETRSKSVFRNPFVCALLSTLSSKGSQLRIFEQIKTDADERKPETIWLPTSAMEKQPFHCCPRGAPAPQAALMVPESMEELVLCYTRREISTSEPWLLRHLRIGILRILNGVLMAERPFFTAVEFWACGSVLICSADDLEAWSPWKMPPISFLPSCLGQMKLWP